MKMKNDAFSNFLYAQNKHVCTSNLLIASRVLSFTNSVRKYLCLNAYLFILACVKCVVFSFSSGNRTFTIVYLLSFYKIMLCDKIL